MLCGPKYPYAIIDLVSHKWIATILAAEATGVHVQILFTKALKAERLLGEDLAVRLALDDQAWIETPTSDTLHLPAASRCGLNETRICCKE